MLMPRDRRPSTAALTSCGERNASESVRLIWRTVHRSRFANCSASVIEPVMISSSHRRPRAIALISRRRRSMRSGRMFSRSAPVGKRIFRNRFDGGFCQGIDNVAASIDRSAGISDMTSWVRCTSIRETSDDRAWWSNLIGSSPLRVRDLSSVTCL